MSSGNTESNSGISESIVDFFVKFPVFSFIPSVLFLSSSNFEVQISDEVLESGD
jgi:hypothetical protein